MSDITIRVLSYNIALLPRTLPGTQPGKKERAQRIPQAIERFDAARGAGYDAIVLQEAFADKLRKKYVIPGLAGRGYGNHTKILGKDHGFLDVYQDGGVMIFSPWPIKSVKEHIFRDGAGFDDKADKGVLYAVIEHPRAPLHVFGTHVQAGGEHARIRASQFTAMKRMIDAERLDPNAIVVMAGDMNVDRAGSEYPPMKKILDASFPDKVQGLGWTSWNKEIDFIDKNDGPRWLDYVMTSNPHLQPSSMTIEAKRYQRQWERYKDLSDHLAVAAELRYGSASLEQFSRLLGRWRRVAHRNHPYPRHYDVTFSPRGAPYRVFHPENNEEIERGRVYRAQDGVLILDSETLRGKQEFRYEFKGNGDEIDLVHAQRGFIQTLRRVG